MTDHSISSERLKKLLEESTPTFPDGKWHVLRVQGEPFVAAPAVAGHPYFGHTRFTDIVSNTRR